MSAYVSGLVQGQASQQTPNTVAEPDAFNKMDLSQFIKLLVAEMQNQDPMNPMDNSQILQQISQIKAIGSNDKLTSTLASLQLQQDMASGATLLHQTVTGLNAEGKMITGTVDKVSVADNKVQLHVGDETLDMKNISTINGVSGSAQLIQDIETGNALLDQTVSGVNAYGTAVTGKVDKVTVSGNIVQLNVGNDTVDLNALSKINGVDSSTLLQQYRENGSSLAGRTIKGLNAEGKMITGKIDTVLVTNGQLLLQVGNTAVNLQDVKEIDNTVTTTTTTDTNTTGS